MIKQFLPAGGETSWSYMESNPPSDPHSRTISRVLFGW